jgi:hypothetical protein
MREMKKGDPAETFIIQVAALSWAATQVPEITVAIQSFLNTGFLSAVQVELSFMNRVPSSRYKGNPVPEFQEILFLNMISAVSLVKHGIHCGTRPWSADEVNGKLSHHGLGDRHESGAKSGAREPACFS